MADRSNEGGNPRRNCATCIKTYNTRVTNRWISLSIAMTILELCAGTAYGFGIYSARIASQFGWTDTQTQLLSSFGNLGLYIAIPAGLLYDYAGPTPTILAGSLISSIGYLLVFLVTAGLIEPNVPLMASFFVIAWHGSTYFDGVAVTLNIQNFPHDRGLVIGLLKSFFGLAGSLLAVTNLTFFFGEATSDNSTNVSTMSCGAQQHESASKFENFGSEVVRRLELTTAEFLSIKTGTGIPILLLLSVINLVPIVVGPFVSQSPANRATKLTRKGLNRLTIGYAFVAALAVYVAVASFALHKLKDNHSSGVFRVLLFTGMCALLAGVMITLSICTSNGKRRKAADEVSLLDDTVASSDDAISTDVSTSDSSFASLKDTSLLQTLCCPNFWLLWFSMFFCTGSGLMVINHLAQIAISFGGKSGSGSVYVTVFGSANALGRMLAGLTSDRLQHKISRPWFFAFAALMMSVGLALLTVDNLNVMYAMCIICGTSYGMFWSLCPALVSELSGLTHLGANYALISLAPAAGAYAYNAGLCAHFYQLMARDNVVDGVALLCCGGSCYRWTAIVSSFTCVLASGLMVILACKTKNWYSARSEHMLSQLS